MHLKNLASVDCPSKNAKVTINAPRSGSIPCMLYEADSISCLALLLLVFASAVLKYWVSFVMLAFSSRSLRLPRR